MTKQFKDHTTYITPIDPKEYSFCEGWDVEQLKTMVWITPTNYERDYGGHYDQGHEVDLPEKFMNEYEGVEAFDGTPKEAVEVLISLGMTRDVSISPNPDDDDVDWATI
ncbi:MAG: hypothetical protein COA63_013875 [Methylophaga sp.]|nr:hypothetical protein [Methylophaga sp.]